MTAMEQVDLFRKNSLGIGTWHIWQGPVQGSSRCQIFIGHCSVEGGSRVTHVDNVVTNSSGRPIQEQVDLQMRSRISRQLDKGYKPTRDEALLGSTNQMGLANPMLAQKVADVTLYQEDLVDATVQPKFDGHRALITKQGGEMLAYSRKGKPITTIAPILEDCDRWMQDGDTLDGELYCHGVALQTIASWIKADQPETQRLSYHWYDMVLPTKFVERLRIMKELHVNCENPRIQLVPTYPIYRMSEVYDFFRGFREQGYEGAMLRLSIAGYEDGKRARQLLKVKDRHDGEATVLSGRPSSTGWAILTVQLESGVTFDLSAPGTNAEKQEVMDNIDKYVGRKLTIAYANLTNDGVPFHCVAVRWHEEL